MKNFVDDEDEEEPVVPANFKSRELTVEILKLLTASLAFAASVIALVSKYPWLSKPWILDGIIALGLLVLVWFAKPRFAHSGGTSKYLQSLLISALKRLASGEMFNLMRSRQRGPLVDIRIG